MNNSSKQKVHLVSTTYSNKGHSFEYINNFYKYLNSKLNIHLITPSSKKFNNPNNIKISFINVDFSRNEAQYFNKFGFLKQYIRGLNKIWLGLNFYRKVFNANQFKTNDIIILMDYELTTLPYFIYNIRKLNPKVIVWFHSAKFQTSDVIYRFHKLLIRLLFRFYINKHLSALIVNGDYIKRITSIYLKIPYKKIKVIQYPSQLNYYKLNQQVARTTLGISHEEKVVLYFGMLRVDKNLHETIEAVAKTKSKVLLVIAGSEASVTREQLLLWIKKYNLQKYILDIQYLSEEKIATYYSAADLFFITYKIDTGSQSGPLSLAREFHLPAVVPDYGEIGYYIKKNGLGFSVKYNYSEAIDKYFALSALEKGKIIDNLKEAKNLYSWQNAAQNYYDLITEIGENS